MKTRYGFDIGKAEKRYLVFLFDLILSMRLSCEYTSEKHHTIIQVLFWETQIALSRSCRIRFTEKIEECGDIYILELILTMFTKSKKDKVTFDTGKL